MRIKIVFKLKDIINFMKDNQIEKEETVVPNLVGSGVVTLQTEEIMLGGFSQDFLQAAMDSLTVERKLSDVNRCYKNWNTEKMPIIERAVFIGIRKMECLNEKTKEVEMKDAALFMDTKKDLYYKIAFNFVKAMQAYEPLQNFRAKCLGREKIANGNLAETFIVNDWY